jgi:hypothetical protein
MKVWLTTPSRRLPAGALLLVLSVSIIVAAILLSLILLATNRRILGQQDSLREQVRGNLFSGLAYAQAHPDLPAFRIHHLDLFGDEADSAQVMRRPWGLFDIMLVTTGKGTFRDTTIALLGSTFSLVNQTALYLSDENMPLTVNDDARVQGGAWLPGKGDVRPGSLPLTGARRAGQAVTGRIRASQPILPLARDSAFTRLRAYAELQLADLLPPGSKSISSQPAIAYSFKGQPLVWYHDGPFTLRGSLAGQVVVVSSQRLVIEAGCKLDNALVLAPTIIIKTGFQGRAQFIARDTVFVGDSCRFAYPSAICAYGNKQTALVSIGAGTQLRGVVLVAAAEPGLACVVRLTPTTTVEGQVFSAGAVENCGLVRGTVMCRRLLYHGVGSYFENYLVNATLDRTALPPAFLSTRLLNPGGHSNVVVWLH